MEKGQRPNDVRSNTSSRTLRGCVVRQGIRPRNFNSGALPTGEVSAGDALACCGNEGCDVHNLVTAVGVVVMIIIAAAMAAAALLRGADWRARGVTLNVVSTKCFS